MSDADMTLGAEVKKTWVYASSQLRPTLHLNEDCPALQQAKTVWQIRADAHPNAVVCRRCDPSVDYRQGPSKPRQSCASCGATLDASGECGFCQRYAEVIAGD